MGSLETTVLKLQFCYFSTQRKPLAKAKQESLKLSDLKFLKNHNGPFTSMEEVSLFLDIKIESEKLYKEAC